MIDIVIVLTTCAAYVLMEALHVPKRWSAIAFASVHVGNPVLSALTFVAGLVWALLYRRYPNLWLLAGSHSVLAALAYPLVLAYAPLSRF